MAADDTSPRFFPSLIRGVRRLPSAPKRGLADVINGWRAEAAICHRRGAQATAVVLEGCADEVAAVAEEFTTFLSEHEAVRRSGWSPEKVRRHARLFLDTPHVRWDGPSKTFTLRACIVPRQSHFG